jgi:hypothetical protein
MMIATVSFFVSLLGVGGLFVLKTAEKKRGSAFFPAHRAKADAYALVFKREVLRLRHQLDTVPPALMYWTRYVLHELALAAARLARTSEKQLHRMADFVSHKRGFEKRETRSEFLKQVGEVKNGGLDGEGGAGQNT